jgi:hypothetical protein
MSVAQAAKVKSSIFCGNGGRGINVRARGSVVTNVVSAMNGDAGVRLSEGGGIKLERSIVARNFTDGVQVDDPIVVAVPSLLKKNVIVGNAEDGVITTTDAVGMVFDGNVSGGNGRHGIALTDHPLGTVLKKNQLIGNAGDGLFVDVPVQATAIVQNGALGNVGSGLNVDNTTSTLAKNRAVANLLNGIRTPFGAIDGGGNVADDNLAPPQCTPPIGCP